MNLKRSRVNVVVLLMRNSSYVNTVLYEEKAKRPIHDSDEIDEIVKRVRDN